jgi:hypothetical protein
MGVTYQLIQKYECGGARICCSRLSSLATLLEVPVAWFFDGLPQTGAGRVTISVPEHKLYSRETVSLAEAYCRLPPDRRRAILQLIRSMIEAPSS